jgi:preprotein translocase subunit SecG
MYGIILTIDIIAALIIIVLVLIQQGKGASMGVSFGSGASNTVFGSKGVSSFLFKLTIFFTALFFVCCLALGYLGKSPSVSSTAAASKTIASQYDYNQYQKETGKTSATTVAKPETKTAPPK